MRLADFRSLASSAEVFVALASSAEVFVAASLHVQPLSLPFRGFPALVSHFVSCLNSCGWLSVSPLLLNLSLPMRSCLSLQYLRRFLIDLLGICISWAPSLCLMSCLTKNALAVAQSRGQSLRRAPAAAAHKRLEASVPCRGEH